MQIKDEEFKRGKENLLDEALRAYKNLVSGLPTEKIVKDSKGKIAYDFGDHYLVAKKSPFGFIVSVNKSLWTGKKIVMYLASSGTFYMFIPSKIKDIQINFRGTVPMVNFSLRNGVNIEEEQKVALEDKQLKLV